MEQPDQNVSQSTAQAPVQPNLSVSKLKKVELANASERVDGRDRKAKGLAVVQDQALKALGNVKLSISIDETKDLPVIKIFDGESGKELLQVPAEHSLNISRTIKAAVGAIFDKKA